MHGSASGSALLALAPIVLSKTAPLLLGGEELIMVGFLFFANCFISHVAYGSGDGNSMA